jgi:hypothetical protein
VDALSGAFIDAASTAGLGVSLVSLKPALPGVVYIVSVRRNASLGFQ